MGVSALRPRLTDHDVHRLVKGETAEERATVAHKLCRRIAIDHLTEEEKSFADEIVQVLLKDAAELVRRTLAVTLRNSPRLSRDAARKLAEDVETVAEPILRSSPVLTDDDLVEIVLAASAAKQEAIASRRALSSKVTETIVYNGFVEAVRTLAANDGAEWTDTAYDASLERFGDDEELKSALVFRSRLPLHVTEKLVSQVSGAVFDRLVNHHELPAQLAIELASNTRERATVDLVQQAGRSQDLCRFTQQLNLTGHLTPSLVMRALCMGHIRFVEYAMAELSGVQHARSWLMIHDAGTLGLQALFDRSGLPRKLLPPFRAAIDIYHETEREGGDLEPNRFQARMIERVLTQFQAIPKDDLDYLLEKLDNLNESKGKEAAA